MPSLVETVERVLSSPRVKCKEMQRIVEMLAPGCSYRRKNRAPASMKFIVGPDGEIRHKAQANKELLTALLEETTSPDAGRLKPKRKDPDEHVRLEKMAAERKIQEIIAELQERVGGKVSAEIQERYGLKVGKVVFQMEPDE